MRPPKSFCTFKFIFIAVFSLTLTSGGTAFYLANQPHLSEQQTRILDSSLAMWTAGSTAMFGLLNSANTPKKNNNP